MKAPNRSRQSKAGYENSYWCCAGNFASDKHERDCPNYRDKLPDVDSDELKRPPQPPENSSPYGASQAEAPTCPAEAGGCCTNRDCQVHKAVWDAHKAIERGAAEAPKPDLANDDFLIAHDDDAEVGLLHITESHLREELRITNANLEKAWAKIRELSQPKSHKEG